MKEWSEAGGTTGRRGADSEAVASAVVMASADVSRSPGEAAIECAEAASGLRLAIIVRRAGMEADPARFACTSRRDRKRPRSSLGPRPRRHPRTPSRRPARSGGTLRGQRRVRRCTRATRRHSCRPDLAAGRHCTLAACGNAREGAIPGRRRPETAAGEGAATRDGLQSRRSWCMPRDEDERRLADRRMRPERSGSRGRFFQRRFTAAAAAWGPRSNERSNQDTR